MKIFVSYTTRDRKINKELLTRLDNELSEFENVYIDLIHNDSLNKQERVFEELESADQIVLIETEQVYQSNWVKAELERANYLKKEVIKISFSELIDYLKPDINIGKSQLLTTYIKNSGLIA
ncbi:TIR domain-containing protein [Winogradskyella psychrotolerans]|uniref:TIR domain-containing protein n=1 Tax=Winogradskyella psychrotolerans TaxID=1344585 RepID=UPI001C0666D3|nr:TIR domain-containing protein [Winogradskyella psychrotolerans]MBU2928220.1 toll/interleukin-1 receptor domain-containing protein [Winogradskyella psychrotolerans]